MARALILYYNITGNTEKMAEAIADGIRSAGVEVDIVYYVDAEDLAKYDAIIVGSPTYHHDTHWTLRGYLRRRLEKTLA